MSISQDPLRNWRKPQFPLGKQPGVSWVMAVSDRLFLWRSISRMAPMLPGA